MEKTLPIVVDKAQGKVVSSHFQLEAREDHLAEKEDQLADKEDHLADKEDRLVEKEACWVEKEDHWDVDLLVDKEVAEEVAAWRSSHPWPAYYHQDSVQYTLITRHVQQQINEG